MQNHQRRDNLPDYQEGITTIIREKGLDHFPGKNWVNSQIDRVKKGK